MTPLEARSAAMQDSGAHRARIAPIPTGEPRPLWSVMIPTYNCAAYLRQSLGSVLAQDTEQSDMQIEVIDDHSTRDDPKAVVDACGGGRVGFFQQPKNLGVVGNLETCLKRAHGRFIHLLHGDDTVLNGFYRSMQSAFEQCPDVGAAFCRHNFIDETGQLLSVSPLEQATSGFLDNGLERLASEQRIMTPSMVVRREVYEHLGGFDRRLLCSEDWEMWVRIAAHYPIWYEVQPLASYRMHSDSNTGRHLRTGEDMRYTRKAIEIFRAYLPSRLARSVVDKARETYALAALRTAEDMLRRRDRPAALVQVREALKLSHSPRVVRRFMSLLAHRSLPSRDENG